jgi:pyrimidine-nucleoside phosphorylase
VGWAVQRLGAGRVRPGEPIDPHAGLAVHAKLGQPVQAGEPLYTLYAAAETLFAEPLALLARAVTITSEREETPALLGEVIVRA